MVFVSSGMICTTFWCSGLDAWPDLNVIVSVVTTLGGGSWFSSSRLFVFGMGTMCSCTTLVNGTVVVLGSCWYVGGTSILKKSSSCFIAWVCLSHSYVSGISWFGCRIVLMSSAA